MSFVKTVQSHTEYTQLLETHKEQLVVVDFTAQWCGPCQAIKPVFATLSGKYRQVVFVQVDVDQLQETAAAAGVTAMPTFQFFKNKTKVAELKGANPQALEQHIVQHQGPVNAEAQASSSVNGYHDLTELVDLRQVECLNQQAGHAVKNIFSSGKEYLESDVDEQLIISIPFKQAVKLHSMKLVAPADKAPKSIKTFINLPHTLSFDEAEGGSFVEELNLTEKDYEAGVISLRFVKYQSVHNLQLFIADNLGGDDVTRIEQLVLYGVPVETTNMADFKKIPDHP